MTGFGNQPFGQTSFGIGDPPITDGSAGVILMDPETGKTEGSRYIDPRTHDFELDEYGRARGQKSVRHLVQMAIQTFKTSSAMKSLGLDLEADVVTADLERRINDALNSAVAHLVAAKMILTLGVARFRAGPSDGLSPGRVYLRFNWRDLATDQVFGELL